MIWVLLAIVSGFCAAAAAIVIKGYLKDINPYLLSFLSSFITLGILVIMELSTKKVNLATITSMGYRQWISIIVLTFLNSLAFIAYATALKFGKPSPVVAIDRLGILYVILLSVIFLNESFTLTTVIGGILMVAGAIVLGLS